MLRFLEWRKKEDVLAFVAAKGDGCKAQSNSDNLPAVVSAPWKSSLHAFRTGL
jgi:hypothetical protein